MSKKTRKKISLDVRPDTAETLKLLKGAYGFKSNGQVLDLVIESFYKAYLEQVSKI